MAQVTNTFIAGKMNKSLDDRLIPKNQYKDGLNIRVDSSDASEAGRVENEKGNERLAQLVFRTTDQGDISLSSAKTIGAYADGQNETIYYFVHDPTVSIGGVTYKYDAIISYNVEQNSLRYIIEQVHPVLSAGSTVLNFDPEHLITGVDLIDNLLFFTDDLNPPRYINIEQSYAGIQRANPYSSLVTEDDISVIVKPPSEAPTFTNFGQESPENYMDDKFICFAYRWRYKNGQYSALSQFTNPSFIAGPFEFDEATQRNKNMRNTFSGANITVDTGSDLVDKIEVVFKEITSNNVYSIERIDRSGLGSPVPSTTTISFENQKIFTLIDPNQLGRIYDNVPLKAKAQTTMGNRIIYGNYVEGYDLTDNNNDDIITNFTTELRNPYIPSFTITPTLINTGSSPTPSSYQFAPTDNASATPNPYTGTYDYPSASQNLGFDLDFSAITFPLLTGQQLSLTIDFSINSTTITTSSPNGGSGAITGFQIQHDYILESDVNSVSDLINEQSFKDSFGLNPQKIRLYPDYSSGGTLADKFLRELYIFAGADASNEDSFGNAGVYSLRTRGTTTAGTGGFILEDTGNNFVTAGVQVGDIIVGQNVNTGGKYQSAKVKSIDSPTQITFEDINANLVFTSSDFLFPGAGTVYGIYDKDLFQTNVVTNPSANILRFQVLNLRLSETTGGSNQKLFLRPFITGVSVDYTIPSNRTLKSDRDYELGIIYMDDYNRSSNVIVSSDDATVFVPVQSAKNRNFIRAAIPTTMTAPSWATRYKFAIKQNKDQYNEFFSNDAYNSTATSESGTGFIYFLLAGENVSKVEENNTIYVKGDRSNDGATFNLETEQLTKVVIEKKVFGKGGFDSTAYPNSPAGVYMRITSDFIDATTNPNFTFTFETQAKELDSFLYYEGVESYPIVNGYHEDGNGNSNQLSTLEIDTTFFNAITFYNGVESRAIYDGLTTKSLQLGNRVYSTSEEEYKQIRRTTDLTYSGVYQGEVGINKLNEFNLALANFKELEESFGPIQKLFARETDVLVLQEDKISYVLAGKNLLSDSVGGGSITSIPEVLGTQIARTEEYGISFNPESFASYGYDRYFTDVKRGAVLQLRGSSARNDQLTVISEFGMRSYFRDTLEPKLYKKVIGAYDEYSNEYVLSATDDNIPQEAFVIRCGSEVIVEGNTTFVVELGEDEGDVTVIAERISGSGTVDLDATWNAVTTNIGTGESGDFNGFFTKSPVGPPTTAEFTYTGTAKYRILVNCPIG